jgi:type II secretory pathway pseudopilin PulG
MLLIKRKKSFSLIELLIFLSLILVMVTVAVPRLDFFSNYFLLHELDKLFVTFSYMQQKAIASNKKYSITFDQITNSYSYMVENSNIMTQLADGVSFGFIEGVMGPPGNPTKKIEKSINLEKIINNADSNFNNEVSFWPNGRVSHGTIYFVDKSHKRMGALTCSVSQVSYIRRYKYENLRWEILGL